MRRSTMRRTYPLATMLRRQVDGVVSVREFVVDVGGGSLRLEHHSPLEIVVRDERGEHRIPMAREGDRRIAVALPVIAYIAARIACARRSRARRSRR